MERLSCRKLLMNQYTNCGQWRSQPTNLGGEMFDFRRITLFWLEKRLSKHKMTIFSKNFVGAWPLWPPGYAYDCGIILTKVCNFTNHEKTEDQCSSTMPSKI